LAGDLNAEHVDWTFNSSSHPDATHTQTHTHTHNTGPQYGTLQKETENFLTVKILETK